MSGLLGRKARRPLLFLALAFLTDDALFAHHLPRSQSAPQCSRSSRGMQLEGIELAGTNAMPPPVFILHLPLLIDNAQGMLTSISDGFEWGTSVSSTLLKRIKLSLRLSLARTESNFRPLGASWATSGRTVSSTSVSPCKTTFWVILPGCVLDFKSSEANCNKQ